MYPAVTKSKNLVWNPLSRKKKTIRFQVAAKFISPPRPQNSICSSKKQYEATKPVSIRPKPMKPKNDHKKSEKKCKKFKTNKKLSSAPPAQNKNIHTKKIFAGRKTQYGANNISRNLSSQNKRKKIRKNCYHENLEPFFFKEFRHLARSKGEHKICFR